MQTTPSPLETDASLLAFDGARSTSRVVNGLREHVVVAGEADDPLVVLLHGFPEFWYEWREQIEPLVEAGYRVVVPDQRGYNLSEKPRKARAYQLRDLSRDVADLIASEGRERAHVVGHDWGGVVAWDLARRYPDRVDHLGIINAPHPTVYRRQLRSNLEQLRRSWYAMAFQLPWLPERLCRYDDFRLLERALRDTAAEGTFTERELTHYRRAWAREGALTGSLNWYRAMARHPPEASRDRVEQPTLVIWGEADNAFVPELGPASVRFCDRGRLERLPETSHWVPHERPARTTELLCDHLDGSED
ncbi:alpha/beta hydrolase [Natronococcus sp. A-GB1]|uniref:alpha/beta fold hydrolase n=1 Tax=Natronococcus sp. A-GB1 TaxID=3037648 RepID=UPI00241E45D2|nr:alpha/beta hydrolase [Natronococcus sp. A-GB1]MDG5759423.1 alpha/beta hydrolase [Natronococcus sp. A-GB1]